MLTYIPKELITDELAYQLVDRLYDNSPALETDKDEYVQLLQNGTYILWGYNNALIVGKTRRNYERQLILELDTATLAGEFDGDFKEALNQIEYEAKLSGVDIIIIKGRDAWRKIHKDYDHYCTTIYKEL